MVDFNPYREWLGVETASSQPNYYELLGLPPFEADADRILHAADQRLNLVRKIRPGEHIDHWQRVLDELIDIRRLLTDLERKRHYDDQLRRQQGLGGGLSAAIVPANPTQQDSDVQVSPVKNLLPPTAEELAREASDVASKPHSGAAISSAPPLSAGHSVAASPASLPMTPAWQPGQPAMPPQQTSSGYGNLPYGTGYGPVVPASYGQGAGGPPAAAFPAPPGVVGGPFAQSPTGFAPMPVPGQPQYGQAQPFGQPAYPGQIPSGPVQPQGYSGVQTPYPNAPGAMPGAMPGTVPGFAGNPFFPGGFGVPQQPAGVPAQQPPWGATAAPPGAVPGWGAPMPGMPSYPGAIAAPQGYAPAAGMATTAPMALPVGRNMPAGNPMAPVGAYGQSPAPFGASPGSSATAMLDEPAPAVSTAPSSAGTLLAGRRRSSQSTMIASAFAAIVGVVVLFVVLQMMNKDKSPVATPEGGGGSQNGNNPPSASPGDAAANVSPQPINTNVPPPSLPKQGSNPNAAPRPGDNPNPNATPPKPADNPPGPNDEPRPAPVNPDNAKPSSPADTMPKPMPDQTPVKPAAIPNPMPVAPATPEAAIAEMTKALAAAKAALLVRNPSEAKVQLTVAASLAKAPDHVAMVKRLETLTHFVGEFWKGVADGMKQLDGVDELVIGELRVRVVEFSDGQITIRAGGKNLRYTTDDVPSGLAEVLFERVRDMKDPLNKMSKGAFHATDKNRGLDSARRIFQEAQLLGGDVEELLAVLDDKYDVKNPPVARAVAKKQHLPDPSAMSEATAQIKARFGKDIAAARTAQQKYDMAKRLMEEAAMPLETEALRMAIFNEARDLAANAHLAQLTVQIIDETEKWFEIDVLATKFDALSKAAVKASPQASRDVALECLQLTDQAEEAKRLDLADKFVRVAGGAARASRDTALAKRATDRAKDIQKVFKDSAKDSAKDAPKDGAKEAPTDAPKNGTKQAPSGAAKGAANDTPSGAAPAAPKNNAKPALQPPAANPNKPAPNSNKPAQDKAAASAAGPNATGTK